MDRRYSPIDDTYGAASGKEPPSYGRRVLLSVLLVLAGLFLYNSIDVVMRLRSDPPRSVVGARLNSDAAAFRSQQRMARACWNYAVVTVQKEYPFGQSLPANPPPGSRSGAGNPSAISVLCWPRLRLVWTRRDSWVRSYEWNTAWLTNPRGTFQRTLHRILDFLNVTQ